ncbi:lysoplasmalogenase [Maribacter algicola]|uniref:Lysoplasmalogenase n=1 Tax=Meishania litoralis TaxID=3434685 RepID=A0ACC7LIT5_9FLAO
MTKILSATVFRWLFFAIVILDILIVNMGDSEYRLVTKPLILISLLAYFSINGKHLSKSTYYLTLAALSLSLMGDISLLFDNRSNQFFILGLVSFLLAHLTYGAVFLKRRNKKFPIYLYGVLLILIAIGMALFFYLKNDLGALTYPVVIYILGILFMACTALMRIGKVPSSSFLWVFIGALFFVASDSVLAINMFKFDVPWANVLVMGTYATAQYLITEGVLRQNKWVR